MTGYIKVETIGKMGEMISHLGQQNEQLQNKLDIAVKALEGIRNVWENNPNMFSYIARLANRKAKTALKEINLLGTSAKEEQ